MLSLKRSMGMFFGSSSLEILQFTRFFGCCQGGSDAENINYVSYLPKGGREGCKTFHSTRSVQRFKNPRDAIKWRMQGTCWDFWLK